MKRREQPRRPPVTLLLGSALIIACEVLLGIDVARRGAAAPDGVVDMLARWVAINMTPLAWVGYLLVVEGLLAWRRGAGAVSPARLRPRRFTLCFVSSVGVWLVFDWVNFSFIHAWSYHGLEAIGPVHAWIARIVAFGAISPAMFMTAELYQQLGLRHVRGPRVALGPRARGAMVVLGVPALLFPFVVQRPIGCLTLWVSLVLVFEPFNYRLGTAATPSLIRDWRDGRWGRTISLMAAGLTCGFFWEFWNYWAAAKWTYDLPFLGRFEAYRLFEMPLAGFAGFAPFALECWVVFETILLVARRVGLRGIEPLPDVDAII